MPLVDAEVLSVVAFVLIVTRDGEHCLHKGGKANFNDESHR